MASRTRGYYRVQRRNHINRKKHIIKDQNMYWHYKFEGYLSKGKIHCSCPMCRRKSYDISSLSDIRKAINASYDVLDSDMNIPFSNSFIGSIRNSINGEGRRDIRTV